MVVATVQNIHDELTQRRVGTWRRYVSEPKNVIRVVILLLVAFAIIFGALKQSASAQVQLP